MGYNIMEVDGVIVGTNHRFPVDVLVSPEAHAINNLTIHTGTLDDVQIPAIIMRDNEHQSDPHTMTIDGRDVSVDGTKLDGIETGAEVNNISDANANLLTDGSDTTLHIHDNRYYTESEVSTSNPGTVNIHWDNITNKPSFGGNNWLEPVNEKYDGSTEPSGSTPAGFSEGDRIIWYSGTGNNQHVYEVQSGSWVDVHTPSTNDTVMVLDDGDASPAQYWFNGTIWIKIADPDYSDHGSQGGLNDDDHLHYLNETRHDALTHDNPHSVTFTQSASADPATDITAAEIEILSDGSDASSIHIHDNRYYTETELNAGQLDNRYYTETELDAGQLDNKYFTETELSSITDGSSGGDLVGATAISGGTATTVQGILEELESMIGGGSGANYNQYFFCHKDVAGLSDGAIPGINHTTLGYKLPRAQMLETVSVLTDVANSNTYIMRKNGTDVKSIAFSSQIDTVEENIDISFAQGDILTAYLDVSASDFNNAYDCDANTLFLGHVDGDIRDDRIFTNACTNLKGNSGRLVGAASGATGNFSNAVQFNGTSDYVKFTNNPAHRMAEATIEMFFNTDDATLDKQTLISLDDKGSNQGDFRLWIEDDGVKFKSNGSGSAKLEQHTIQTINTGQWYHIAVVLGASGFKLFFDGISIFEDPSWTQALYETRGKGAIGTNIDGCEDELWDAPKEFFKGRIDEIRISKVRRYETNFTVPTAAFTSDTDTVALWHFDETSGNIALDSSDTPQHFMYQATGSLSEVKTDQVKFGTHSLKLNNSVNDWMYMIHNDEFETTTITIETWMYIHNNANGMIFQKGDSTVEGGLIVKWIQSDERIEVDYWGAGTSSIVITTTNNIFPLLEFHHILVSIDVNDMATSYGLPSRIKSAIYSKFSPCSLSIGNVSNNFLARGKSFIKAFLSSLRVDFFHVSKSLLISLIVS